MKKIFIVTLILLLSCNKDDDSNNTNPLIGNWKETEVRQRYNETDEWGQWFNRYLDTRINFIDNTFLLSTFNGQETLLRYEYLPQENLIKTYEADTQEFITQNKLFIINENEIVTEFYALNYFTQVKYNRIASP